MSYQDTYLRAGDLATLQAALLAAGVLEQPTDAQGAPQGGPVLAAGYALDDIGTLLDWDYSDPEAPVATPLAGHHCNLRHRGLSVPQQDALAAVTIPAPATPHRVWA